MFFMIDNRDSFVYNLSAYMEELGEEVRVVRCDKVNLEEFAALSPEGIVISPGPGTPGEAVVSAEALRRFAGQIPILGVCLGHQVIGETFGARVKKGARPMHGKVTDMFHDGKGVFAGLPLCYKVTRYHSLVVEEDSLPVCLKVTAKSVDGAVMGIRHRELPVYGVQFHPEAVLTEYGHELLKNFVEICREWGKKDV